MRDYLDGQESDASFSRLCGMLAKDRCAVFVGAGLSMHAGYRSWWNGIYDGFQGDIVDRPGLLALAGVAEEEIAAFKDDLPRIAELCEERLEPNQFQDFLKTEFGEAGHDLDYALPHFILWNINFRQIITTNFDPCLFKSSNKEQCDDLISYPNLTLKEKRSLYHLHGRAFITANENNADEVRFLRNIVYTSRQFEQAYKIEAEIAHFLYNVVHTFRLVFVAFSMEDKDFKETVRTVNNQRILIEKKIAREIGRDEYLPDPHFVFLESPLREYFASVQAFEQRKNETTELEHELKNMGFQVIRFFRQNEEYRGLIRALQDLKKAAPCVALPEAKEPTFRLSSSDDASSTGS